MSDLFERGVERKKERKADPIWDCLAKLFYPSGVPSMVRGQLNKVVADLKILGATPQSIREKHAQYRREWPKMVCTPCSLVKNWDCFAPEKPTLQPGIPLENQPPDVQRKYAAWKEWNEARQ